MACPYKVSFGARSVLVHVRALHVSMDAYNSAIVLFTATASVKSLVININK